MIEINGTSIPMPSKYEISRKDLMASAERGSTGILQKTKIRTITQITCGWNYLNQEQINTILKHLENDCTINYLNIDGTMKNGLFYANDRTANVYKLVDNKLTPVADWENFEIIFTEI